MGKIAIKIWLGFMAFLCLIFLVLTLCMRTWLEPAYEAWFVSSTQKAICAQFDDMPVDAVTAASRMESIYRGQVVLATEGEGIVYASDMLPNAQTVKRAVEEMGAAAAQNGVYRIVNPRTNIAYDLIWQRIGLHGQPASAFVVVPEQSFHDTARFLFNQFVLIALFLIPVGGLLAFFVAKLFSKPIRHIQQATLALTEGRLDTRVSVRSRDEIGLLSRYINDLAAQLGRVEALRQELIANVSHELRTPLSLIQGYAEILMDVSCGEDNEKGREHVQIILDEVSRLKVLAGDILDYSQMRTGIVRLDKTAFDFSAVLEEICYRYQVFPGQVHKETVTEIEKDCVIYADEGRMIQVVHNVINNAYNYVSPGGAIGIRLFRQENGVCLEVENTVARPLDEEELALVFERYYRKKDGRRAGTGLGLAVVKGILDAHSIPFSIFNTKTGGGSVCFQMCIEPPGMGEAAECGSPRIETEG